VQQEGNPDSIALSTPFKIQPVSFAQFARLARQRDLSVGDLANRFRGRIENPAEFFSRVLSGKHPDTFIPYRSVLKFYALIAFGKETKGEKMRLHENDREGSIV
jgi:hypothetical protein